MTEIIREMNMLIKFKATELSEFATNIFKAKGVQATLAEKVSNSLVSTSLAGLDSHGVILLIRYMNEIESGQIHPDAEAEVVFDDGPISLVDGHFGFGYIVAMKGMELAIEKAGSYGVSVVGFKHTNHIGRLGQYGLRAAEKNLIALGICNAGANVAPYGSKKRLFGTNPISCAVPVRKGRAILIDLATSVIPEGKVRLAKNERRLVDKSILIDPNGEPTNIPDELYLGGALLPIGGYKGSALSLMVEILCGIMTGTGCAAFNDWPEGNGVLFIVIDPSKFRVLEHFFDDVDKMISAIKNLSPVQGLEEVLLPGEPEQKCENKRKKEGIPIDGETWSKLIEMSRRLNVELPQPLEAI
jgi:uncharacterized oxidoreductase